MSSFGAMAAAPPTFGYDAGDMPIVAQQRWDSRPIAASASLSATMGDIAQGNVMVDTSVPLRGFLLGVAFLTALRIAWEVMPD